MLYGPDSSISQTLNNYNKKLAKVLEQSKIWRQPMKKVKYLQFLLFHFAEFYWVRYTDAFRNLHVRIKWINWDAFISRQMENLDEILYLLSHNRITARVDFKFSESNETARLFNNNKTGLLCLKEHALVYESHHHWKTMYDIVFNPSLQNSILCKKREVQHDGRLRV